MILFWSALTVAFAMALALWKIGQRQIGPHRLDPYYLYDLVGALLWTSMCFGWAYPAWVELQDVSAALRTGAQTLDVSSLADRIDSARATLVWWGGGFLLSLVTVALAVAATVKAFMRRAADASAKLQETHA